MCVIYDPKPDMNETEARQLILLGLVAMPGEEFKLSEEDWGLVKKYKLDRHFYAMAA